jgi:hypothetical protein
MRCLRSIVVISGLLICFSATLRCDEPPHVATAALVQLANLDEGTVTKLKEKQHSQGRIIYELKKDEGKATYMIVLSKPYLLSFYAKDPKRVAWVVIGAYKSSCEKGNSVSRIK